MFTDLECSVPSGMANPSSGAEWIENRRRRVRKLTLVGVGTRLVRAGC